MLDYALVTDIELEDVDTRDYPDMCDAHIISAFYEGRPMTEEEIIELNDDGDFIYNAVINYLF